MPKDSIIDPEDAAISAGLTYVNDDMPGITRIRSGKGFSYKGPDGRTITDKAERKRLASLAIPPAYTDVWICSDPRGHLQATGRDARGRKQYRYHPAFRAQQDAAKFARLGKFGACLPALRAQVEKDISARGTSRRCVIATIIHLLDCTAIRIGNETYARQNRSYGLTTLRTRHVNVSSTAVRFHFRGKSGVEHEVTLRDRRLARLMRRCMELPGQQLFQYLDEDGQRRAVSSNDVNLYLREMTGRDFTAKDYRTWAGSALALERLRKLDASSASVARQNLVETVKQVASQLGNTPAVCRQCYIHPAILQAFSDGELVKLRVARKRKWLSAEEVALLAFLRKAAD